MYSETVTKLVSQGARAYASKDFEQAATSYADACAAHNEEQSRDDPDLLLLYGKALFQNGVAKSGVLGSVGGASGSEAKADNGGGKGDDENDDNREFHFHEGVAEEIADGDDSNENDEAAESEGNEDKTNAEVEEDGSTEVPAGSEENDAPEAEQSDFEAAWDILDLTRALFEEKAEEEAGKETEKRESPYLDSDDDEPKSKYVETIKKLAETYDLLGEVSLETENFPQAASDLESCLELRQKLYDSSTSSWVSESHYKLSLALEFCVEDSEQRHKAAGQVKLAIDIVTAQKEMLKDQDDAKKLEKQELLCDLEERYNELQKDPEQEEQAQQMDMIRGLLGDAAAGPSAAKALTDALQKKLPVNDLSSMVKKRKANPAMESAKKPKQE